MGLTQDFTRIGWNAVTTLGTGGVPGLVLNSGLFGTRPLKRRNQTY